MPARRVPVLVVAGFLGSGKTTLLNYLLNNSGSTRIGVVVNDFGAINIDAMAVAGQVDSGVALSNGCLCCAIDPRDLDRTLHRLSKPSSGIDVIVVEASGLADPREIVRMLLASTDRNISYGGLVELVDAVEFETTMAGHPEFITHIDFADLVLLNKTDRVTPTARAGIQERISTISPGKPVVCTEHGRVDPELLFDRRHHQRRGQLSFDDLHDHHGHAHTAYESVAFTSTEPLNPRRLMEFLNQRPRGLYRIKGNVHFGIDGHRQKFVLHTVGSYLRFRTTRWERGESRATNIVAIGSDIDRDSVTERLHACVRSRAEITDDERAMLEVLRFTEN